MYSLGKKNRRKNFYRISNFIVLVLISSFLLSCSPSIEQDNEVLITPSHTLAAPTSTPVSIPKLMIGKEVPKDIAEYVISALEGQVQLTEDEETASLFIRAGTQNPVANWIYALAVPFPTVMDGISEQKLRAIWTGKVYDDLSGTLLKMDEETLRVFTAIWGKPAENSILIDNEISDTEYEVDFDQQALYLIPFGDIKPQWKILKINEQSPIQKEFDPFSYPLTVSFNIQSFSGEEDDANFPIQSSSIFTNRDSSKLTDIMLTGVTALVRGTALVMEQKGVLYPGEDIRSQTRAVDFMHVNNEVPFTIDCPYPELNSKIGLVFCSDTRYYDLLEDIGTDIIEVSGDHFSDYGVEGAFYTLNLYDQKKTPYYGGGRNAEDARQPLLLEHNGNKIAMLGCNGKNNKYYAPADENTPGAILCDFDWLESDIAQLKSEGYVVIVTFQHVEYYSYEAQPILVEDFGHAAAAGADIVSGSQSHQAHGFAFQNGAFIHYGLGNLFFDQYKYCAGSVCDYGFMDRHIIYEGRHINTEIIPIRFIDMARPRLMTLEEKEVFLDIIFNASNWAIEDYSLEKK